MNKLVLLIAFSAIHLVAVAQREKKSPVSNKISMIAEKWNYGPGACEFVEYKSTAAMRILNSKDTITLKDFDFTSGTIEYDIEPMDKDFTGVFFRRKNSSESECFYLRTFAAGTNNVMAAVQYTPIVDGTSFWNLLPHCQGAASFNKGQWNHVKLVVAGAQMLVYVNDMHHPALQISQLEGNTTTGGVGFNGQAVIANLVVSPNQTENVSPIAGFDPFCNDPRYLRQWSATKPSPLPTGHEPTTSDLPKEGTAWTKIKAERRGLINLTRTFGNNKGTRQVVWLKCRLKVAETQSRKVDFGFTNEVWIFLNGKLAVVDKNFFDQILCKVPRARCSTENTSFTLQLQAGDNELMIAVANDSFGWGIVARLDVIDGIQVVGE